MKDHIRFDIEFNWNNFRNWAILDLMFFEKLDVIYSIYIVLFSIQIFKFRFHIDLDIPLPIIRGE